MIIDLGVWDWLGLGLALLCLEVVITGVFLFWVGLASLSVAFILLVFPSITWQIQLLCFGIATLCYVLVWSYFGRSRFATKAQDQASNLNARTLHYIGQVRPLTEAIVGGKGALVIDDSRWVVSATIDLPQSALVKVVEIQGACLVVVAQDSDSSR